MNVNLIHGGTADVVQLVHTLLARQRHLRHVDRLITDAISEALTWVPVSLNSEAMNAGTYVDQIWRTITREASFGSNQTSTSPSQIAAAPSVLLQPGFPSTWEEIQYMLPNVSVQVAGGYRRRAWRGAVEQAIGVHHESRGDTERDGNDASLYIIQRDDEGQIPNWPEGVERPPHPVRDLPGRHRGPGRRRHCIPRPRPRWAGSGEAPVTSAEHTAAGREDLSGYTRRRVPLRSWHHGVPRGLGGSGGMVRRRGSSSSRDVRHPPRREHLPRQDRSRSRDPE